MSEGAEQSAAAARSAATHCASPIDAASCNGRISRRRGGGNLPLPDCLPVVYPVLLTPPPLPPPPPPSPPPNPPPPAPLSSPSTAPLLTPPPPLPPPIVFDVPSVQPVAAPTPSTPAVAAGFIADRSQGPAASVSAPFATRSSMRSGRPQLTASNRGVAWRAAPPPFISVAAATTSFPSTSS